MFIEEEILNFQIILVSRQNMQYLFYDENNNAAKTDHFPYPWGTIGMRVGHDWHGELKKILVDKNIGWYPSGSIFVQKY